MGKRSGDGALFFPTMTKLTKAEIAAARQARYRRRMDLRVASPAEAVEFVNDVGFCFLFPIQNVEMPSLWDAIAGRVVKTTNKHHGYEIERTWGWKDDSLNKKWWFYGKLIRAKATLVSLDFLPNFYALSENYGDYEQDYLEEYRAGRLTAEAKAIYEALLKHGALDAVRLRREAHLTSEESQTRYNKALTELQAGLKVLPVGVAEAGAWNYAFIYELLPRWFPDVPEKARHITRAEARRAILDQYLRNAIATTVPTAARVFGWPTAEARQTAEGLAEEGRVMLDVKVAGLGELQIVTKKNANAKKRRR
ncbi:MAG: winged helix DNA-binding domain-containing protein [Chloroflexi bacterium]|nr:winged helix DNA-binding domain-containing protein [Chloroflexota bacterium]